MRTSWSLFFKNQQWVALMANEALVNLFGWCKQERERLKVQLEALVAGRFTTRSNDGSGWRDTTQENIDRVRQNISELDQIIADYVAGKFDTPKV